MEHNAENLQEIHYIDIIFPCHLATDIHYSYIKYSLIVSVMMISTIHMVTDKWVAIDFSENKIDGIINTS